jgi:hypothetical protein
LSLVSSPRTKEDVDGRNKADHDGDGVRRTASPATARAYTLTIWGIALGILIFAAGGQELLFSPPAPPAFPSPHLPLTVVSTR